MHLSRRLRAALLEWSMASGHPDEEAEVPSRFDRSNFYRRSWKPLLRRAQIGKVRPKDLRDSYASYPLTAGIQFGYVSKQLGHANVATTATHYARWAGGDAYRSPMELEPGEVPADLLARLVAPHDASMRLLPGEGLQGAAIGRQP